MRRVRTDITRPFGAAFALAALALLCSAAAGPESEKARALRFNRGPYIVRTTGTGVTILFETNVGAEAVLRYGEGEALDCEIRLEARAFDYKVLKEGVEKGTKRGWLKEKMLRDEHAFEYRADLADLKPGTRYGYAVEAGGTRAGPAWFRTVPEPAKAGRFTFIAYGDSRTGADVHRRVAARFLAHAPAFLLHVGDYTDCGGYVFWNEQHFAPLRGVIDRVPLWPTQGDHEGREAFRRAFGMAADAPLHYSFDYGNVHAACLCGERGLSAEEFEWLKKDLAGSHATWRIAFYHRPAVDEAAFHRLGVDLTFAGHHHSYQRYLPLSSKAAPGHLVTHVITGGGGAPLKGIGRRHPCRAAAASRYHYVVVDVDGERLTLRAIGEDGEEFDRVSWSKPGGRPDPEYAKLAKSLDDMKGAE